MYVKVHSKKGSTSVFLTMILLTIIFVIAIIAEATNSEAARPYVNSVLDLAGRSILSEYDDNLKNDYSIFGLVTDEEIVKDKLQFYLEESLRTDSNKTSFFNIKIEDISIDLSSYALTNFKNFEEQIYRYMKSRFVLEEINILDLFTEIDLSQREYKGKEDNTKRSDRTLRNNRVISKLPSRQSFNKQPNLLDVLNLPDVDNLTSISLERIYLNLYVLKHFRHNLNDSSWDNTFFVNEIEYILSGRLNDRSNYNIVKSSLFALRAGINLTHINTDPQKRDAVNKAAALLTPGPEAVATQIIISGIWASAEAINDVKRLEEGGKVPLIKTNEDWALSLENVLDNITESSSENIDQEKGLSYEEYLFLFLCFKNKETILIRMMDIIQLNMQGNHNENFALSKCYSGFSSKYILSKKNDFLITSYKKGVFNATHVY